MALNRSYRFFVRRFKKYTRYFSLAERIDFQLPQPLKQTASTRDVYLSDIFSVNRI